MPASKLKTLLLLMLGIHLVPSLADAPWSGTPSPQNTAFINTGSVEYVVLGGYIGYLDLLHAEYRRAVLYNENRHYTYFDPPRGGSAHIPTFETPIHGFGWGRQNESTARHAHSLRPPAPPLRLPEGLASPGSVGPGILTMAATPLVDGEGPPVVTPVPEPGTYLMLVSGLAVLYWRLRRRPAMPASQSSTQTIQPDASA